MKAGLYLEDGTFLEGKSFGAEGEKGGELVFNTAMTGYQEMLTDPSYSGQVLMFTYPMIGNYGVNEADVESSRIHVSGVVVGDYIDAYSNHRAKRSLSDYLKSQDIVGIHQVDTRYLTRKIRERGAMRAYLCAGDLKEKILKERLNSVPSMEGLNLVKQVATSMPYVWENENQEGSHVVVVDCGVKWNMLRLLSEAGCRVSVVPPDITSEKLKQMKPDGVLFSNGPGDPAVVTSAIELAKELIGVYPILGICLGHQILALAAGGKTYKLSFGHHGANHPVKNLATGRIEITSQNHGFAVDLDSLMKSSQGRFGKIEMTHTHLSDNTVEGFALPDVKVVAVQFHPEAAPGPHDSKNIFKEFVECIKKFSTR